MTDSEKIKYLIDLLDDTANGFANNIGLDQATGVYNILRGRYNISKSFAERVVAVYTNVNKNWLLGDDENPFTWGDFPKNESKVEEPSVEYKQKKCLNCDAKDKEIEFYKEQLDEIRRDKRNLEEWIGELRADKILLSNCIDQLRDRKSVV